MFDIRLTTPLTTFNDYSQSPTQCQPQRIRWTVHSHDSRTIFARFSLTKRFLKKRFLLERVRNHMQLIEFKYEHYKHIPYIVSLSQLKGNVIHKWNNKWKTRKNHQKDDGKHTWHFEYNPNMDLSLYNLMRYMDYKFGILIMMILTDRLPLNYYMMRFEYYKKYNIHHKEHQIDKKTCPICDDNDQFDDIFHFFYKCNKFEMHRNLMIYNIQHKLPYLNNDEIPFKTLIYPYTLKYTKWKDTYKAIDSIFIWRELIKFMYNTNRFENHKYTQQLIKNVYNKILAQEKEEKKKQKEIEKRKQERKDQQKRWKKIRMEMGLLPWNDPLDTNDTN